MGDAALDWGYLALADALNSPYAMVKASQHLHHTPRQSSCLERCLIEGTWVRTMDLVPRYQANAYGRFELSPRMSHDSTG